MLTTNFRRYQSTGSRVEDFKSDFTIYECGGILSHVIRMIKAILSFYTDVQCTCAVKANEHVTPLVKRHTEK